MVGLFWAGIGMNGQLHELKGTGQIQLGPDIGTVKDDRFHAQVKLISHLFGPISLADEAEYLQLTIGETLDG